MTPPPSSLGTSSAMASDPVRAIEDAHADPVAVVQEAWERSTRGEWENDGGSVFVRGRLSWLMGDGVPADCDFTIASHNAWPAIAAEVTRLRAENARLRAALEDIRYSTGGAPEMKQNSLFIRCVTRVNGIASAALAESALLARSQREGGK